MATKYQYQPRAAVSQERPVVDMSRFEDFDHLYQILLDVGKDRGEKLKLLRAAILRQDTREVYRIAAALCGLGKNYHEPKQ